MKTSTPARHLLIAVCAAGLAIELVLYPVLSGWGGDIIENFKWYFGLSINRAFDNGAGTGLAYVMDTLFHFALVAGLVLGITSGGTAERRTPQTTNYGQPGPAAWGTPTRQDIPSPPLN